MKITSYRNVKLDQGAQAPSIEVQRFVQSVFSMANFFFNILSVKSGEVEVNYRIVIEK